MVMESMGVPGIPGSGKTPVTDVIIMGLTHHIRAAHRFLEKLTESERHALVGCCRDIQAAQSQLNRACEAAFAYCVAQCQGKCCKNIHIDSIISRLDCLFILALNRGLFPDLIECAERVGLYSADCPFLIDGVGPCLFPADQKPEQCIITFCTPVSTAHRPIRRVRIAFTRLWGHVFFRRPFFWLGW